MHSRVVSVIDMDHSLTPVTVSIESALTTVEEGDGVMLMFNVSINTDAIEDITLTLDCIDGPASKWVLTRFSDWWVRNSRCK